MKVNESIFDYVERIKDLRIVIIDAKVAFYKYLNKFDFNAFDVEVLASFINRLVF